MENCSRFIFFLTNNTEKLRVELALFCIEKSVHVTSDIISIVCTLTDNSYEPISMQEF